MKKIKVVIGSYGSYAESNARALGSAWLDLASFNAWEEVEEELRAQGFELNGIDEELFIQDIEGADIPESVSPCKLFNIIHESGVLKSEYAFECMQAILEAFSFFDFAEMVERYGEDFTSYVTFYKEYSLIDLAYELVEECESLSEFASRYFDYEAFARDLGFDGYVEVKNGIIRID